MPELPEVETVARQLAPLLVGRRVRSIEVRDPLLGLTPPPPVAGRRIDQVFRLGKQVMIGFVHPRRADDRLWLAVHLRMTGRLLWLDAPPAAPADGRPAPLRALWRLDRGALMFHDTRRFGTIRVLDDPASARPEGLDPMTPEFTPESLRGLMRRSSQPVKCWLLRQDRLVGLGNIYASEALFVARIHPARPVGKLTARETARLHAAIRDVLERAIAAGGTTFSDFQNARGDIGNYQKNLMVYDHAGDPCPVCGTPIERIVQQQRSTFYCRRCQRA